MSTSEPCLSCGRRIGNAGVFSLISILCALTVTTAVASDGPTSRNRVTLIYEGYVQAIEDRELVPGVSDDGARYVASTMAIVESPDAVVFVDPGFIADRTLILDALDKAHVDTELVTHVFISHHHPDHTVNTALFPNATVVDFWATYRGDLWQDHGDNYAIDRGVTVIRTPGHTNEDASLVVDTKLGKVVFTHVWWNETLFPPIDPIADDQAALDESCLLYTSDAADDSIRV